MAKKIILEESFEALEEIIDELQGGGLTLEESFKKYEQGMKLVKGCNDAIDRVEKKLLIINSPAAGDGTVDPNTSRAGEDEE